MALTTNTTVSKPAYGGLLTPNPTVGNSLASLTNKNPVTPTSQTVNQPNYETSSGKAMYVPPPTSPGVSNQPMTGLVSPQQAHAQLISNLPKTGGSHTQTDAMGNTSKLTLPTPETGITPSAPAAKAPDDASNQYNTSTGELNSNYSGQIHAPGTPGNGGATGTQTTPTSTLGNVTTPSGAVVDSSTGGLVSAPAQGGNPYIQQIASSAGQNAAIGEKAANIASQYGKQIAQVGQGGANAESGYLTTGTTPVATGNAGVIARNVAAQQGALASGESAALQGTGQQLTAQGAVTSGLTSAGGLAQNQVVSPGQAVFNPSTGQYTSASSGGGNPSTAPSGIDQSAWDNYVNLAANGQISAVPSSITGNTNLSGQLNAAASAINPNYTPITSAAQGGVTAQNIGTAGTANTQVAASGYASILPQYQQATTDFSTADKQATNLLNTLKETGINSTNATDYNTTINNLATKLGSTQTTAFTTALTEAQQAYTKLLSSVGAATPTVNGEAATSVLNPSSTPAQIAESIDKLNEAAYAKLAPQYDQALTYYNQLHGTNVTAIPGYPAPTKPTPVSSGVPQGPDTSPTNLGYAGAGTAINAGAGLAGGISSFVNGVLKLF